MFKKLQNLLFEDDDEELEDAPLDEPVSVQPVQQAAAPIVEEVKEVVEPTPQPIPAVNVELPKQEEVQMPEPPVFDEIFEQEPVAAPVQEVKAEEPVKPLGITIDAPEKPKSQPKKKTETPKKAKVENKPKQETKKTEYYFSPVISPIFGVDEKDLNAVKNTTAKISSAEKNKKSSMNNGGIISPMYGSDMSESLTAPAEIRESAVNTAFEKVTEMPVFPKEDDIPEFSLDDILKVRDEEFIEESRTSKIEPLFPDFEFDDDDEQTQVISKKDLK